MTTLLQASGVSVSYGGVHANRDIDLEIAEGGFVGLIGANGAGKTTFIDAITGFTPLSGGTVTFDGQDVTGAAPDVRSRLGLVRTFQSLELFEDLSVRDNLRVACEDAPWWALRQRRERPSQESSDDAAAWALGLVGLTALADRLPADLSHGQRKLVGVARALAGRPKLVLLDEPAAGLDAAESRELSVVLRGLVDAGISVFLIDHDMGLVLSVCDRIYVLNFGEVVAQGTPAQVRRDPAVIAAYLGSGEDEALAAPASTEAVA